MYQAVGESVVRNVKGRVTLEYCSSREEAQKRALELNYRLVGLMIDDLLPILKEIPGVDAKLPYLMDLRNTCHRRANELGYPWR